MESAPVAVVEETPDTDLPVASAEELVVGVVDGEEPGSGSPVALRWLEDAIRREPTSFDFFQAVRVLERLQPGRSPVGRFVDPAEEVVRFSVNPAISFPPSELHALEMPEEGTPRMTVNFLGLTGPLGVLPVHYTLLIADRRRAKDGAIGAFFDLFHHRLLSLFYRAWEKHRFTIGYEKREEDRLTRHLGDLVGMGLEAAQERHPFPDDVFLFYAGLLAPQQRSAVALEQLLEDFFGSPVEVEQFVGAWYPLPEREQCLLGEDVGAAVQLGTGAVVGDEIWDSQAKVRLRIGPLSRERFEEFLPTGSAHARLSALTRFFGHGQYEFEVQLVLAGGEVPACVLGDDAPLPLGWSTWIRSAPRARDADETILTL